MQRIQISELKERSVWRPPGYFEEVMQSGLVEGDFLILEDEKYQKLCRKFSSDPAITATVIEGRVIPTKESGPGSLLSVLIHSLTGKKSNECGPCSARAKQMNAWGWIGCWQNRKQIAQWLIEEAGKLGTKTDEAKALAVLKSILPR